MPKFIPILAFSLAILSLLYWVKIPRATQLLAALTF